MFVDSMDCFLTYNLSCINGTFAQLNSSSLIFGEIFHPSGIPGDEHPNNELALQANHAEPSSVFVSLQHCIITSIILGTIIVATITGNIFVIAAVKLEKSLHAVAYYLFVSLAVADLFIATVVMPITLLKEVTRSWILGSFVCETFVTIDLLCCTASILHLVAIALDRYWSITNLDYATKRTPARILMLICTIWVSSILISSSHLFPIFRDPNGRSSDQCRLIGNVPYTIISTVGAFYIPLIGMCIIYWKIFQAAKFRIRRKAFNSNHAAHAPTSATPITDAGKQQQQNDGPLTSETPHHERSLADKTKYQTFAPSPFKKRLKGKSILSKTHSHDIEPEHQSTLSLPAGQPHHEYQLTPLKKATLSLLKKSRAGLATTTGTAASTPAIAPATPDHLKHDGGDDSPQVNPPASISSTRRLITSSLNHDSPITVNTITNPLGNANTSLPSSSHITDTTSSKVASTTVVTGANNNGSHPTNRTVLTKTLSSSTRKKIDIKRERKATKVLGVVMGCFILCWLPFFIEETICGLFHLTINEKIISVLTWLGYLNSLLNPVIYTIFSPDFRQAFKKILFGKYRKRRR